MKKKKTASFRNYQQSMGLWINEPLLQQPEEIDQAIQGLADGGYEIVRLFLRNSNHTHRSPEVVKAIGRAVRVAHRLKLRAVLDCEPHAIVCQDMIRQFPGAMGIKLFRYSAPLIDGHWTLRVEQTQTPAMPIFDGIEAAFLNSDGKIKRIKPLYTRSRGTDRVSNGNIHREMFYREGVPGTFQRTHELRGMLAGVKSGEIIAYVRFASRGLPDFWADDYTRYFDDLLDCYRDVPLDGVAWDEPAADVDWSCYRYGDAFAGAFRKLNGYVLADKLHLLDEVGMSPAAVKVRLDYYRTLNEGLARAQGRLVSRAKRLFGENLLTGSHHTWQGEGGSADYRAGAVDYFRLNDNMDAGYTDCCWWDPDSVAYTFCLASSLGRLTRTGEAEVNTWHYKPTVSNIRRNVSLMTLLNITWFNIWFGKDCDCVLQQGHYTWPTTSMLTRQHRDLQRQIGARRPVIDVAILHGWEGVCGWNRLGLANAHKAFCLNTSRLLVERNIAFDFIDQRLLDESRIVDGRMVNTLGSYRVLILPYALVLSRKGLQMCRKLAAAGGRVIFVGTPVTFDSSGRSLSRAFAELLEIPPMSAEHYMTGLNAVCTLPTFRPQRLEVCRPLPVDLPRMFRSAEGECHGVTNRDASVRFLSDLDPGQRLIEQFEDALLPGVEAHGDNLLWRLYAGQQGEMLALVAREDRPARGIVRWAGRTIQITAGSVGLWQVRDNASFITGDLAWTPLS